jgi:SAM-dependent methyltransferase
MVARRRIAPRLAADRQTPPPRGVRNDYAAHPDGAAGFYADEGSSYRNPHSGAVIGALSLLSWSPTDRILDLCCGSGEVTGALVSLGVPLALIEASDPYTGEAYAARWGRTVDANWSFDDLARGALPTDRYDRVVCSYALHLCPTSLLPTVCVQLALAVAELVVVTPHKRPMLRDEWGFVLVEEHRHDQTRARVRRYERR